MAPVVLRVERLLELQTGDATSAGDRVVADEIAVVGRRAVGDPKHCVAVRRQKKGLFEGGHVSDDPRRDHDDHRDRSERDQSGATPDREVLRHQHQWDDEEHGQEDGFAATQRREPDSRPEQRHVAPGRLLPEAVARQDHEPGDEREEPFRQDEPVDHPEVRVRSCDDGGDDTGAGTRDAPPDQADDQHRPRTEQARGDLVREVARLTEKRWDREHNRVQRWVHRGRHVGLELPEPPDPGIRESVAVRDQVGLLMEVEAISESRVLGCDLGDVQQAPGQRGKHDDSEQDPEVPLAPTPRCGLAHWWLSPTFALGARRRCEIRMSGRSSR